MTEKKGYRDGESLRALYYDNKMSQREIADHFNVSVGAIQYWMDKNDIEPKDRSEAHRRSMWKGPAPFDTTPHGYERWKTTVENETVQIYVHRLLAVSEFGFENVIENDVHHKNGMKWDNRPENIGFMSRSDHKSHHASETDGYIGKNLDLYD